VIEAIVITWISLLEKLKKQKEKRNKKKINQNLITYVLESIFLSSFTPQ